MADGPRLIDRVREHYARTTRTVSVPALGVDLHFSPLTVQDSAAVESRGPKNDRERSIYLLIHKARLPDGTPAFQMGDFAYLVGECDVTEVLGPMLEGLYGPAATSTDAIKDAKDAVAADPTSDSA